MANRVNKVKIGRMKKAEENKKKWATDKKYLAQQKEKGYERINGKWVKISKGLQNGNNQ